LIHRMRQLEKEVEQLTAKCASFEARASAVS